MICLARLLQKQCERGLKLRLEACRPTNRLSWVVIFKSDLKNNKTPNSRRVGGKKRWDERDLIE